MGASPTQTAASTARELFEPCFKPGAVIHYRNLTFKKPDWATGDQNIWVLHVDGQYECTIYTSSFHSSEELAEFIGDLA